MSAFELELGVGVVALPTFGVIAWLGERWRERRRYLRCLSNIARLELELGLRAPEPSWVQRPVDRVVELVGNPYSFRTRDDRLPPRAIYAPTAPVTFGYDGPPLTDADVRRLEHPGEFA